MFVYITEGAIKKGNRVWIIVHRDRLIDQISRTLDSFGIDHGIASAGYHVDREKQVQVCSVWSIGRISDQLERPDFIICDEAHHFVAKTYQSIRDKYPESKLLGVTATPELLSGKGLSGSFDVMIRGAEVQDLIDQGYLCKPIYYCQPNRIDFSALRSRAGDYNREECDQIMDRPEIFGDAIDHYRRICDGVPAIAFCPSVRFAEKVADQFCAAGYRFASIDGKMSRDEQRGLIDSLSSGRLNGLTSCDLIGEGVDIPVVTAAILLRPTQSLALHLQQVGRVLRPAQNKPNAIILDHVGNCLRHGLAEERREWTLEGKCDERKSTKEGLAVDRLSQCPKCYVVHRPAPSCAVCGHIYESKRKDLKQVSGELVELGKSISGKRFVSCPICKKPHSEGLKTCPSCSHDYQKAFQSDKKRTRSFTELMHIGRKKGMRNPAAWAAKLINARKLKESS
jgi:superfamily II DNA or RNA helicase